MNTAKYGLGKHLGNFRLNPLMLIARVIGWPAIFFPWPFVISFLQGLWMLSNGGNFWIALLLIVLPIAALIAAVIYWQRMPTVKLFEQGFMYLHCRSADMFRWGEITSIQMDWQPSTKFPKVHIKRGDGLEITLDSKIGAFYDLLPQLHARFIASRLEMIQYRFETGRTLSFGELTCSHDSGVSLPDGRTITFDHLVAILHYEKDVYFITLDDKVGSSRATPFFLLKTDLPKPYPISKIENYPLFFALAEEIDIPVRTAYESSYFGEKILTAYEMPPVSETASM